MKTKFFLVVSLACLFIGNCLGQVNIVVPPVLSDLCPGGSAKPLGTIIIRETNLRDFDTTGFSGGNRQFYYFQLAIEPGFQFETAGTVQYVGAAVHNNNGSDIGPTVVNVTKDAIYFSYKMNPNPALPKNAWDSDIGAFVWSGITVKAKNTTSPGTTARIYRLDHANTDAKQNGNNYSDGNTHGNVSAGGFVVDLIADKIEICEETPVKLTATPSASDSYEFFVKNNNPTGTQPITWASVRAASNVNTYDIPTTSLINNGNSKLDTTYKVKVIKDGCPVEKTVKIAIKPTPTANDLNMPATYFTSDNPVSIPSKFAYTPPVGTINPSSGYSGSGVIGSTFYPSTFSGSASPIIYYQVTLNGCVSGKGKLAQITIQPEVTPPPAFLELPNNESSLCMSGGNQNVTVTMCASCIIANVVTNPTTAKVGESSITPYSRTVEINPTQNNNSKIEITVTYVNSSLGIVSETAEIPIFPTQTPSLNGLPIYYYSYKVSDVPKMYWTSICKSNDSARLYAFPENSTISLYKSHEDDATDIAKHILIPMSSGLIGNPNKNSSLDSINFVPNQIFRKALSSSPDSVMIVKVKNIQTGSCNGDLYYIVGFASSYANDIKLNVLTQPPFCIGDTIAFNISSAIAQPYYGGWCGGCKVYERYSWYYGDGKVFLSDTSRNVKYHYSNPGEYTLRFTAIRPYPGPQCPVDSVVKIIVGVQPYSDFLVKDNYAPNPIYLKNLSSYNKGGSTTTKDSISVWHWYMGDGFDVVSDKDTSGRYNYNYPGNSPLFKIYPISLVTTTDVGCKDSTTKYVPYFPLETPNATPYEEDFNTSSTGWFDNGQYKERNDSSSWRNIIPNGEKINLTDQGKAWITSKTRTSEEPAGYYKNEKSWVESPVFDLSEMDRPMISFDTWALAENQLDGANLQYCIIDTLFGHETWTTVGEPEKGFNWYNSGIVISKSLPGNKFDAGWTGNTGDTWNTSSYYLDNVKTASVSKKIRFRLSFTSNADNAPGVYDGFAFDNFFVGERNRMVLIEEIVSNQYMDPSVEAIAVDPQAINIKYFAGHMGADPINQMNRADPSARALLYGIDSLPRAVVDGIKFQNKKFSVDSWGEEEYVLRTLNVSPFEITVKCSVSGGKAIVNADIKKSNNKVVTGPFVVQVAVVEKSLTVNGVTYYNVLRKLLPNAAGTRIDDSNWTFGEVHPVTYEWNPSFAPQDGYNFVVFVQDENTKEVYQANFDEMTFLDAKTLTLKPSLKSSMSVSNMDFSVHPNPSSGNINVLLSELNDQPINWAIMQNNGSVVLNGQIQSYTNIQQIPTEQLPSGMYFLRLEVNGESIIKKIVIVD